MSWQPTTSRCKRMTNISREAYYENIDVPDRHIRLLHLRRGSFADPIVCELSVVPLDNALDFEALSYAWGALDVTRAITLRNHQVEVTVNLFNALRRLRCANKERRPLWVDALCINQRDDVEKSRQVSMMGEIYTKTSGALLWLGDFDENNSVSKSTGLKHDTAALTVSASSLTSQTPPNTIDREVGEAAFDLICYKTSPTTNIWRTMPVQRPRRRDFWHLAKSMSFHGGLECGQSKRRSSHRGAHLSAATGR